MSKARAAQAPRTPAYRAVRFGDRYGKIGFVWAIEHPEKAGCATVVFRAEHRNAEASYSRLPLWRVCEMEPLSIEPRNRIAIEFRGLGGEPWLS